MNKSLLALVAILGTRPACGQFGQNQVITRDFDWKVRSTEHFNIYYYEGSKPLLGEAAQILETAFARAPRALDIPTAPPPWLAGSEKKRWEWERRPFFLYASPNDFAQSTIADTGDGTGGVTEPYKNRFMVYNNGTLQWLDEVITHEFTHILQFHVLVHGFWKSGRILKTIVYPLWFIEGMPGYITYGIESSIEETTIRDAATSAGLLPLVKLEHFGHLKPHQVTLAYKEGSAALEFLAEQYGARKVGDMLKLFESRFETSQVLMDLIGLDAFEFDRKFREYEEAKYRRIVKREGLREPDSYGGQLTKSRGNIPEWDVSPVFSPDFKTMYYVSTRAGYPPEVFELDVRTGKTRRLPHADYVRVENIMTGSFAFISRILAISPDGTKLAFSGTRNHRDALYLYDIPSRRLERKELPGFMSAISPSFSPDGQKLVFSGMRNSFTDLYVYDLKTDRIDQLTDDPQDDAMPVFTPDGSAVIYSSEVSDLRDPYWHERRLFRFDLRDRSITRLEESGAEARDPVVSADGKKALFIREDESYSEICELDLATRQVTRLTRTIGGNYTPVYASVDGSELAFSSLRRGSVHIYKGPRGDFLSEPLPPVAAPEHVAPVNPPGIADIQPSTSSMALSGEQPYRTAWSTDLFLPAFFYSSIGGFFWTSYWQGSDLLGRHSATALVNYHSSQDFQYSGRYSYTPKRPQFVAGADGFAYPELIDASTGDTITDSAYSEFLGVSYPFDRYHRAEADLQAVSERKNDKIDGVITNSEARYGTVSLVRDTARGRYLVETQGDRLRLSFLDTAQVLGGGIRYYAAAAEAHKFLQTGTQSALAFRLAGVESVGPNTPQFILGGVGGVRGYARSTVENEGSRLAVLNSEWRFPILPDLNYYMWYFFPDFYFKAVYGTIFDDAGYAWTSRRQLTQAQWPSLRNSVGLGIRIYTFILQEFPLLISMDWAQRTTQNGGIFYVYLGQVF